MNACKVCDGQLPPRNRTFCSPECKALSEKARARARYEADKSAWIQRAAEWKQANPEASRASGRRTAAKTKDQKREYDAVYRAANRERYSEHQRAWYKKHADHAKDVGREYASRRRARVNLNGAFTVTPRDYARLLRRANGSCTYCHVALTDKTTHWDHVLPIARGGTHSVGNLVPACAPCNQSKSSKLLIEWQGREQGFDLSSLTILTA
jgi:5-methylcytosine-specific restriction endonuclease McrA